MAIEESKISDLIAAYKKYEQKCWGNNDLINKGRARVYRAVIEDLEALLPRKTFADVAGDDLDVHVGTWIEVEGLKALIINFKGNSLHVTFPKTRENYWIDSRSAYPLDLRRVWDEDGDPVY